MTTLPKFNKIIFMVLFFLMFVCASSYAQNLTPETVEPFKIDIVSGKSLVMKSDMNIKRVSIGSPEIADFILLSSKELYIKGKAAGLTNMILWHDGKVTSIYDIEVKYDLSRLKEKLYQILPDEEEIRIMSTNDSLTLSGRISSAASLSQAVNLAKSYAPEGKVNNLLTVGGTHQVMLEVKIAELSRSVGKDLGINLGVAFSIGDLTATVLSGFGSNLLPSLDGGGNPGFKGGGRYTRGDATWAGTFNALKENGLLKIMAEPNLVALSGQTASFLAGGEFPVPVDAGDGAIGIDWKDFGVGVSFTPNVISRDKISIQVASSVSEIDFSTAIQIEGYIAPGVNIRKAATMIELGDGQSFAIAGLLSENIRENVQKFPFLGDIPILGTLFKSSSFQKNETELVIIVTPRFVKPINKEAQPVPPDYYTEPDDTQFYFNTDPPVEKASKDGSAVGKMDGQFGHSFEE
jgi:pilus assembly protein CpaC